MNNMQAMMSSVTDQWDTPQNVIDDLATVFNWDLDVCASSANICAYYFDDAENGLIRDWSGLCWMNPPYGREIGKWMDKARESGNGWQTAVVCLVPARTDTKWWHENVPHASIVVFVKGRLRFGGAESGAPFPSAFVVFGNLFHEQVFQLASYGWMVQP